MIAAIGAKVHFVSQGKCVEMTITSVREDGLVNMVGEKHYDSTPVEDVTHLVTMPYSQKQANHVKYDESGSEHTWHYTDQCPN